MEDNDTKRRFFEAAHSILASEGYGALKQATVCARVGVTTGAFYGAFRSWDYFSAELLADWHRERTTVTAEFARSHAEPLEQLRALAEAAVTLRHKSEGAIRIWAGVDPKVAEVQRAVDRERFLVIHEGMTRLLGDGPADGRVRTHGNKPRLSQPGA